MIVTRGQSCLLHCVQSAVRINPCTVLEILKFSCFIHSRLLSSVLSSTWFQFLGNIVMAFKYSLWSPLFNKFYFWTVQSVLNECKTESSTTWFESITSFCYLWKTIDYKIWFTLCIPAGKLCCQLFSTIVTERLKDDSRIVAEQDGSILSGNRSLYATVVPVACLQAWKPVPSVGGDYRSHWYMVSSNLVYRGDSVRTEVRSKQ